MKTFPISLDDETHAKLKMIKDYLGCTNLSDTISKVIIAYTLGGKHD